MAFHFSWDKFSDAFVENAAELLTGALNKGTKPSIIADTITVKELNMGSKPPALELIELCDLQAEEFKGVFRMRYSGDAHIIMQTKVQANPLLNRPTTQLPFSPVQMVAADAPLTVPMFLQLSDMELDGTVILLFTKAKGLSMVFRNDPLSKVLVTSTFDGIPVIRDFLQAQIEKKLRQLLCDDLPAIVQQLSLAWADRVPSPKVRPTNLNFAVPPIEPAREPYKAGLHRVHTHGRARPTMAGYDATQSIPQLYRNQSFTGRGQLTPFTPAIAQAIYKSTSLSALDLAERKARQSASKTTMTSATRSAKTSPERRTVKKHSVIRLGSAATTPSLENTPMQTPAVAARQVPAPVTVASYFDKDSPCSVDVKTPVRLQVIQENDSPVAFTQDRKVKSNAGNATQREQQQWMEKKLMQKVTQERRQASLEQSLHRVSLR